LDANDVGSGLVDDFGVRDVGLHVLRARLLGDALVLRGDLDVVVGVEAALEALDGLAQTLADLWEPARPKTSSTMSRMMISSPIPRFGTGSS
jgi:hypothetical protein